MNPLLRVNSSCTTEAKIEDRKAKRVAIIERMRAKTAKFIEDYEEEGISSSYQG